MAKSLYISTTDINSGKSLVALGIMGMLLRKTKRVAYFRPIIRDHVNGIRNKHIDLILTYFGLDMLYERTYVYEEREANALISRGKTGDMVERILQKYKELEDEYDFVLIEGKTLSVASAGTEQDLNAIIAKNLGSPVLLVNSGFKRSVEQIIDAVKISAKGFIEKKCEVLGAIINRLDPQVRNELFRRIPEEMPKPMNCFYAINYDPKLAAPTIKEIAEVLHAKILFGENRMQRQATDYTIAAAHLPVFLDFIKDRSLIITPGDRIDILLAVIAASKSANAAQPVGIVLTLDILPNETTMKILRGMPELLPILAVKENTYEIVSKLMNMHSELMPEFPRKIDLALHAFEENVNIEALGDKIYQSKTKTVTPMMFEYSLVKKAKQNKKRIVLPEGEDDRILKAAEILLKKNIVDITILGDEDDIRRRARELGLNIERADLFDPKKSPKTEEYAKILYELRKEKGLSEFMARDLMNDISYFGTMMVHTGEAHGMVSGANHTTQHTIRPALQFIKTVPGCSTVSSVFFMCLEDRVLVYGDCAVNPNPTAEELAEIAIASAKTAVSFGIEAKVAMLSYSSGDSGKGEEVEKVRKATAIVKEKWPELLIEGPIQYDAAVDPETGKKKLPGSKVAGQATVLIFPDLNTGNNTYKAVQRETGAIAIGPVLQGLNRPVNDLSRGCLVPDIVNTVVITAIQAQSM